MVKIVMVKKIRQKLMSLKLLQQPAQAKVSPKSTCSSGFTLVELIVYMGLFMGFLALLSGVLVSTLQSQQQSIETARIEQDSHYLFSRLNYDINRAEELLVPFENGDIQPSLTLSTGEEEISYLLENERLKIVTNTSADVLTSPGIAVKQFQVRRLGNEEGFPSIKIRIDLESKYGDREFPESRQLNYTFGLR